jgi:ParB-like chromosome segregation protein Spo0J
MEKEIGREQKIADYLFHLEGKPIEQALAIKDLLDNGYTQKEIAKAMGWTQSQISKRLRLLKLIPELIEKVKNGEIRPSIAQKLASLPPEKQKEYLNKEKILMKDVEKDIRNYSLSKDIINIIETPIEPEAKFDEETANKIRDAMKDVMDLLGIALNKLSESKITANVVFDPKNGLFKIEFEKL